MRVPTRTVEMVDAWAAKHEVSRSEAFRRIMQAGFERIGLAETRPPAVVTQRGPSGLAATRAAAKARPTKNGSQPNE